MTNQLHYHMKTLNEEIGRIKDIMLINELGGGSLEDFMDMGFKKDREENPYMSKKYNPDIMMMIGQMNVLEIMIKLKIHLKIILKREMV